MHILNYLRENEFIPSEKNDDWFDRGNIRVAMSPGCSDAVQLIGFAGEPEYGSLIWKVEFSHSTPSCVVIAAIEAALS
jgi:hypothetical protein